MIKAMPPAVFSDGGTIPKSLKKSMNSVDIISKLKKPQNAIFRVTVQGSGGFVNACTRHPW